MAPYSVASAFTYFFNPLLFAATNDAVSPLVRAASFTVSLQRDASASFSAPGVRLPTTDTPVLRPAGRGLRGVASEAAPHPPPLGPSFQAAGDGPPAPGALNQLIARCDVSPALTASPTAVLLCASFV